MALNYDQWSAAYTSYEEHAARSGRLEAESGVLRPSPLELVQSVYHDKLAGFSSNHAYAEQGSMHLSVLLHRVTVKELFPVSSPAALEQLLGLNLEVLRWLVDHRHVLLVMQRPEVYRKLTYLHPIIMGRFTPACYEIRDSEIYASLSSDRYTDLVELGRKHPIFGKGREFPPELQEPYEHHLVGTNPRWRQRNAQRYAALAALIGVEELDEALAVPLRGTLSARQIAGAQARFFYLHRKLLHPLTQGLGGSPYSVEHLEPGRELRTIDDENTTETELLNLIGAALPSRSSISLIEKLQSSDIPERFEKLERGILSAEHVQKNSTTIARDVMSVLDDVIEGASTLERKVSTPLNVGVKIVGIGSAVAIARHDPEASVTVGALAGAMPRKYMDIVVDAFYRTFRRDYLPWQYWYLTRKIGRFDV